MDAVEMQPNIRPEALLTPELVAQWLEIEVSTLAAWRTQQDHPLPYIKVGSRVRYVRSEVQLYLDSMRRAPSRKEV